MGEFCKTVTIFEGPDGSGKTTAAAYYADVIGARYVHLGPFTGVNRCLARLYIEAMLPALYGYQDVVLDRSWLSEGIYGAVYRDGADRIRAWRRRMLERVAMKCEAQVVLCLPGINRCVSNFNARRNLGGEYLDTEDHLRAVYLGYEEAHESGEFTDLQTHLYDYETNSETDLKELRGTHPTHPVRDVTGGNLDAPFVIVGDSVEATREHDSLFKAPFVSFGGKCSAAWITSRLQAAKIKEHELLWISTENNCLEHVEELLDTAPREHVFALGRDAALLLADTEYPFMMVNHPQHARKFGMNKGYKLIKAILKVRTLKALGGNR